MSWGSVFALGFTTGVVVTLQVRATIWSIRYRRAVKAEEGA